MPASVLKRHIDQRFIIIVIAIAIIIIAIIIVIYTMITIISITIIIIISATNTVISIISKLSLMIRRDISVQNCRPTAPRKGRTPSTENAV